MPSIARPMIGAILREHELFKYKGTMGAISLKHKMSDLFMDTTPKGKTTKRTSLKYLPAYSHSLKGIPWLKGARLEAYSFTTKDETGAKVKNILYVFVSANEEVLYITMETLTEGSYTAGDWQSELARYNGYPPALMPNQLIAKGVLRKHKEEVYVPPPDTTAPGILDIAHVGVTPNAATVTVTSDEDCTAKLMVAGGPTLESNTPSKAHTFNLTGLTPDTSYQYTIQATDAAGNTATSEAHTLSTLPPPDVTAPTISSLEVLNITPTSAVISWKTDEDAIGKVDFGLTPTYGQAAERPSARAQFVEMTGLQPETTYHFKVHAIDAAGNETVSEDISFTTATPPDTTPPVFAGLEVTSVSQTSAAIRLVTDEDTSAVLDFGPTQEYGARFESATRGKEHLFEITDLEPETEYHFRVQAVDAAGNASGSDDNAFKTLPPSYTDVETAAPLWYIKGEVVFLVRLEKSQVVAAKLNIGGEVTDLVITNQGTDEVTDGILTSVEFGESAIVVQGKGAVLFSSKDGSVLHSEAVLATKMGEEITADSSEPAPPRDTTAPAVAELKAINVKSDSVTITWTTDEPALTVLEMGPSTSYGTTLESKEPKTTHSFTVTGLPASTQFHYRVKCIDAVGNVSVSDDQTFTTLPPPDTTAPAIDVIGAGNITSRSASISWRTNEASVGVLTVMAGEAVQEFKSETPSTSHSIPLTGLAPKTEYYFVVTAQDAAGNTSESEKQMFTTPEEVVGKLLEAPLGDGTGVLSVVYSDSKLVSLTLQSRIYGTVPLVISSQTQSRALTGAMTNARIGPSGPVTTGTVSVRFDTQFVLTSFTATMVIEGRSVTAYYSAAKSFPLM